MRQPFGPRKVWVRNLILRKKGSGSQARTIATRLFTIAEAASDLFSSALVLSVATLAKRLVGETTGYHEKLSELNYLYRSCEHSWAHDESILVVSHKSRKKDEVTRETRLSSVRKVLRCIYYATMYRSWPRSEVIGVELNFSRWEIGRLFCPTLIHQEWNDLVMHLFARISLKED